MIAKDMFDVLEKYWGYSSFLPLQEESVVSIMNGRDSLTVLPTGGGKSLCYQLPAIISEGMAVVVSPLISLMKDQVDGLINMGVDAAFLNSSLSTAEAVNVIERVRDSKVKLLYVAPERLMVPSTVNILNSIKVSFFVIDEAHCISHWGHDFRPAYRGLTMIKNRFPGVSVHGFTATATKSVQQDILDQIGLQDADLHVGSVDRENLSYRVFQRGGILRQVMDVLNQHENEAGIIYCLRRKDVDDLTSKLNREGIRALPYHAGLSDKLRHKHQEAFLKEEVDVMVATVAFGMGIDRSNIRFVIHAAMPKSLEHYQQETGRAGRDRLPAHCYLFYGGNDFRLLSSFAADTPNEEEMMKKLGQMYAYCSQPQCRHKVIAEYFGETFEMDSCGNCDFCLDEVEMIDDAVTVGQKILSCVARVNRGREFGFGGGYIADVLRGKMSERVIDLRHDELSTFGLMKEKTISYIRFMVEQLVGQKFLLRHGEYGSLGLTPKGVLLLKGQAEPKLAKPLEAKRKKDIRSKRKRRHDEDWAGVDEGLFEALRQKRLEIARDKGVPPYIIFGDKSLKDMAMIKPVNRTEFATVFGVGERKLDEYCDVFTEVVRGYGG